MKHKLSITLLLLSFFIITQIIGIVLLNAYAPTTQIIKDPNTSKEEIIIEQPELPLGFDYEEGPNYLSIVFSIILALFVFSFLMKYDLRIIIKIWFILVIIIAIVLALYPFIKPYTNYASLIAIIISLPLVYFKIIKPNFYVHNLTELLIYPGIAIVFVSFIYTPANILSGIIFIIILLILISIYDAWAVWKSGFMQKMAKYQMEKLQVFGGFLIPSISEKDKKRIKNIKQKYKNKKIPDKIKNKKMKVNLAILGGGDVVFPIITAGIFMWSFPQQALLGIPGLIPALFIMGGAITGLTYLFINTIKQKAYPAMPYITTGIFLGLLLWYLLFII